MMSLGKVVLLGKGSVNTETKKQENKLHLTYVQVTNGKEQVINGNYQNNQQDNNKMIIIICKAVEKWGKRDKTKKPRKLIVINKYHMAKRSNKQQLTIK